MARDSRSWKLTQETHVVLKKYLDVVNAVFQHGQAIDAHAEREAADFFRVVVHEAVDGGIHHARAEKLDGSRKIAKRNVRINGQAFHLMKNEGVRGIWIVAAVDLARHNHADRRLALLHGANLHGRSVRAEKQRLGRALGQLQIKGVHIVADRMEFGNIERFEVV